MDRSTWHDLVEKSKTHGGFSKKEDEELSSVKFIIKVARLKSPPTSKFSVF
jgi:hypothetical protein